MTVSLTKRLAFTALAMLIPLLLAICGYVGYVWIGTTQGTAQTTGTISGLGLRAPVRVIRDERGIPHIRAASLHDAAFAQGYVTGADRLFQIDIMRRFVLGTLAEMFGRARSTPTKTRAWSIYAASSIANMRTSRRPIATRCKRTPTA